MSKILIGVATAALWFVLSYAANADSVCKQVCEQGTCVSKCVEHSEPDVILHEHEGLRERHDGHGAGIRVPGGDVEMDR